jgi:hypothetical protein
MPVRLYIEILITGIAYTIILCAAQQKPCLPPYPAKDFTGCVNYATDKKLLARAELNVLLSFSAYTEA